MEGAKGVQLAEKGLESWAKRAWVDVNPISPIPAFPKGEGVRKET
jgi:hypothetical protein